MEAFQERVVAEKEQLDHKIEMLDNFIKGQIFPTISAEEQERMERQFVHMRNYSEVLGERIAAF